MQNKPFIYLTLLLLLPLTTQCMKREHAELIPFQQKTIPELQKNRDEFKQKLDHTQSLFCFGVMVCPSSLFVACTYRQDLHKKPYIQVIDIKFIPTNIQNEMCFRHFNIDRLKDLEKVPLEILKNVLTDKGYSGLGSATMAENVSFQEKQEFIKKLRDLGFEPTPTDKELALVERWERIEPIKHIYLKKICLLNYIINNSQLPRELVQYILYLKFNTELLF